MSVPETRKQSPIEILLFGILLMVMFTYFYHPDGWNANSRLSLIFSVVHEGRTEIDSYHNKPGTETQDKAFYNDHYYSDKAIGVSLLGVLVYAPLNRLIEISRASVNIDVVKYFLTIMLAGIPGAFCGMLIHQLCFHIASTRFSNPHLVAFLAATGSVLATMYFPFSLILFSHILSAALLFVTFYLIFQMKIQVNNVKIGNAFLVGILLGMAVITEYTTAIIAVCLVIYYLFEIYSKVATRKIWILLFPFFGGVIPLIIQIIYNIHSFDTWFTIPYIYLENDYFRTEMAKGFFGIHLPSLKVLFYLTFHPSMGIFWQSPILLIIPFGLVGMWKSEIYRTEAILVAVIASSMLLINSGYYMWWGGASFAPRHLVPMLPFLALPFLFVPKKLVPVGIALGLISLVQMMLVSMVRVDVDNDLLQHIEQMGMFEYNTIFSYIVPNLQDQYMAINLGKIFNLDGFQSAIPAIVFLCFMLVIILKITCVADKREKKQPADQAVG